MWIIESKQSMWIFESIGIDGLMNVLFQVKILEIAYQPQKTNMQILISIFRVLSRVHKYH